MTIIKTLWEQAKSSRAWRHGNKYLKFRWMHYHRYKKGRLSKIELAFMGRRYR